MAIGLIAYFKWRKKLIQNPSLYVWHGLYILIMLSSSSICNQLFSALNCRPIEMIYDKRFNTMAGMQMFAFIMSLHLAYTLGTMFTPLWDQLETSSNKSHKNTSWWPRRTNSNEHVFSGIRSSDRYYTNPQQI